MEPAIKRLFKRVAVGGKDECWPFEGAKTRDGFGRVRGGERGKPDQRSNHIVFEYFSKAPVPPDMLVELTCGNNACCNFNHMRLAPRNRNVFGTKISEYDAEVILHSTKPRPELAEEYGVSLDVIHTIKHGHVWKTLKRMGNKLSA